MVERQQQQQLAILAGDGGDEASSTTTPPPCRCRPTAAGRGSRRWFRCSAHPNSLVGSGGGLIQRRCWPSRPCRWRLRKGKDGGWKGIFISLPTEEAKMISKIHKRAKMAKWRLSRGGVELINMLGSSSTSGARGLPMN
uniref:Uncharacterized protein n=1 Tax=Oryza barthii TaxID=65489 RepID=A0A0D3HBS8_9ORYZ